MRNGRVLYDGPTSRVIDYLAEIGHPVPPGESPSDVLMEVVTSAMSVGARYAPHFFSLQIGSTVFLNWTGFWRGNRQWSDQGGGQMTLFLLLIEMERPTL